MRRLGRKTPSRHDIWHLDEVVVTISGKKHWLRRAVDQDGYVFDEIVQSRRDTKAAERLLGRLLKKQGCPPRRMITDKPGSRSCQEPSTARTKGSITERRIRNYRCASASGSCRAFDPQEGYRGSPQCFPPSATTSSHPVPAAPHLQPIFIASRLWQCGSLQPASLFEPAR